MNRTVDGEDVGMKLVTFAFEDIVALAGGEVTCPFSFDSGVIAVEQVSIDLISEFAWGGKFVRFGRFLEVMAKLAILETATSKAAEGLFVAGCSAMV
jgi:hypothetical protein